MKRNLLIGLIFCLLLFSGIIISAPILQVGPVTITGTIQEISWVPDKFVKRIEEMSGSAGTDRLQGNG